MARDIRAYFAKWAATYDQYERLVRERKLDWLYELQAEYYPTLPEIADAFHNPGWGVSFTRMNQWVWLWEAVPGFDARHTGSRSATSRQ